MALPWHIAAPLPLLLAVLLGAPASAYVLRRDAAGEPVRWQGPVRLVVDPQLDAQLRTFGALPAIRAAAAAYEATGLGLQVEIMPGDTRGVGFDFEKREANQNDIVVPAVWEYDAPTIAVTILTVDARTHRILDADIALNAQHRRFRVLPAPGDPTSSPWDDVQNTLTHELGHVMGLSHNPEAPESVMFPTALRGETSKRVLSEDDRAGLQALYGSAATALAGEGVPELGCSASGASGATTAALLLLMLVALTRRRRPLLLRAGKTGRLLALAAWLAPSGALASAPQRETPDLEEARLVATGRVVRVQTQLPSNAHGLLRTEVEVEVERCYRGSCPHRLVVVLPGGRWGDVEQHVEGHGLPSHGEPVALVMGGSDSTSGWPERRPARIYSLSLVRDLRAFAAGLARLQGRTSTTPATLLR